MTLKTCKKFICTRMGIIALTWAIGISLILVLGIAVATISRKLQLAMLILIAFILSVCALVTIFTRYADLEKFPKTAFFNIGFTYLYSFMSIGILAVDLTFSLYNRETENLEEQIQYEKVMQIMWNIIYWGSLVHGTIFGQFFSMFWTSGHFSVGRKIKHSLKRLVIKIIALIVLLAILIGVGYTLIGLEGLNGIQAALMVLSNVYSMLVLVILLAYGLFNLPVFLWKYPDNKTLLLTTLETAEDVRKSYRAALVDFHTQVSQCKNLAINHRSEQNSQYLDILLKELPEKDLEGQNIGHSNYFNFDLKKGQAATEDMIANFRYQFKLAFFLYKRKKARWITMFAQIDSLIEKPVQYDESYIKINLSSKRPQNDNVSLDNLVLKAKPNSWKKIIAFRVLALFALMFCIFVLITEGTVIFSPEKTLIYFIVEGNKTASFLVVSFTILFLAFITLVCFFTIFNLKMSDYLQLVPGHTDCITFSSITGLCCKIITVSCFNYMTILGEIAPGKVSDIYSTSYVDFYSSMIKVPFFGDYFNTIMPLFILIFGLMFAAMSILKMQNKALNAFKKISLSKEEKAKEEELLQKQDTRDSQSSKQSQQAKKAPVAELALIDKIMRGERAIIAEFEMIKKREERNKLTRFNNVMPSAKEADNESNLKATDKSIKKGIFKKSVQKNNKSQDDKKESLLLDSSENSSSINKNSSDTDDELSEEYKAPVKTAAAKNGFKSTDKTQQNQKQYGIFAKGKIMEDDSEDIEKQSLKNKNDKKLNPFRKASRDSEDSNSDAQRQNSNSSVSSSENFSKTQGVFAKTNMDDSRKKSDKRRKSLKDFKKEGFLLKKKSKAIFGISQWQKRYVCLDNDKLIFYEDSGKKQARKNIDMSMVKTVVFHYDQTAPVKSKKLEKGSKDESRFDVYTPHRVYMLRTDGSLLESESWVRTLKQAAQRFNPKYGQ